MWATLQEFQRDITRTFSATNIPLEKLGHLENLGIPAGYPEGGVTGQFWMKQFQVDHSMACAKNVHGRI